MKKGFTLIELVMVIVILGILAATALPRFMDLTGNARISATQGTLGNVRAAVAIYYAKDAVENPASNNHFPTDIDSTTNAASLFAEGKVPNSPISSPATNDVKTVTTDPASADGTSAWVYNSSNGKVWINNTGSDKNGKGWFSY